MIPTQPYAGGLFNQIIVGVVAVLGSLYLYRGIETRIVQLEARVMALEHVTSKVIKEAVKDED